jgi:hypothetical protein
LAKASTKKSARVADFFVLNQFAQDAVWWLYALQV